MHVVKVELEGIATSFRYPFFVVGRHPTYEMPPPATIYGHICSAAGELLDPAGLSFGYMFRHEGKAVDLEHAHMVGAAGGKMILPREDRVVPKVMDGSVTPLAREFFFLPRLTLYVSPPETERYFRNPRYPVALGRSQDLAAYISVRTVDLALAQTAYYESTLLPVTLGTAGHGIGVTMPRWLDLARQRAPTYGQYIMITRRLLPEDATGVGGPVGHWVDPETPSIDGAHRGVSFLTFVD